MGPGFITNVPAAISTLVTETERKRTNDQFGDSTLLSFSSSPTTCCFEGSAPVGDTFQMSQETRALGTFQMSQETRDLGTFQMSQETRDLAATSEVALSELFVATLRKRSTDHLCDSSIPSFSPSATAYHLTTTSSAGVVLQAGGSAATRTALVSVGSFVLLAIVVVVIVVAFRRQARLAPEEGAQLKYPLDGDLEAFEDPVAAEIEGENPLTLMGTTANAGFEFESDD
jgi:hypothetical protein